MSILLLQIIISTFFYEKGERLRIESSTIGMDSARSYRTSMTTVRRYTIMDYQEEVDQSNTLLNTNVSEGEEGASLTEESNQSTQETESAASVYWQNRLSLSLNRTTIRSSSENTAAQIHDQTIRYIFHLLFPSKTGRFQQWLEENGYTKSNQTQTTETVQWNWGATLSTGKQLATVQPRTLTTSLKVLNYSEDSWTTESEDTQFSTQGCVKTADGREITFNVNVGMSREFTEYFHQDLELSQFTMCDPLVINLDTDVAELTDQNIYFDIDGDGEKDQIASLSSKSGYLALDKNNDGVINDGNELFGAKSGNGFADLAEYDQDGNGWIDENDDIWSKLQIWCKDENGEDVLYRLQDKGVGAICLQNVSTDFALKNEEGRMQGNIRNTGFFLYESGMAGTIQHVDVAKYAAEA